MAVNELGQERDLAERQWSAAVATQTQAELDLLQLGQTALTRATAAGRPAIVLAGRSYNAFTPEGSQSVGKKLSSMGVTAIPADCLSPAGAGPTSWHFANQVMNAVNVVKQNPNLFLLCVSTLHHRCFHPRMLTEMGSAHSHRMTSHRRRLRTNP
jgi:predicted nucleotide-binding protein (sugar kinase/HSP70/actin superfamily)